MRDIKKALLFSVLVLPLACAPATHMLTAWKDPDIERLTLARPLVVFQHPDEELRNSVEDELAERIPGAVPAHIVGPGEQSVVAEAVAREQPGAYDSLIVTRLVGVRTEAEVVAPWKSPLNDPFWYPIQYQRAAMEARTPLIDKTNVATVVSQVYSLTPPTEGQLIWTGHSETLDAKSYAKLARSVARSSMKAMAKDGLVIDDEADPAEAER